MTYVNTDPKTCTSGNKAYEFLELCKIMGYAWIYIIQGKYTFGFGR